MLQRALNKVKTDYINQLSLILQLANHCNKALDKETLLLLYPLGDFSYTNVNISTSKLSDVNIETVFIGVYTKIGVYRQSHSITS